MNSEVYNYLANYSQDANKIDRLITSAFIHVNDISIVNNLLLKSLSINVYEDEWDNLQEFTAIWKKNKLLFDFEELIELFEFVVSPSDKIINGAIYTPVYIRNYIISESYKALKTPINKALFVDFSCGCGAFLFSLARLIKDKSGASYATIFPNLYGLDITAYSIDRTKILLSLLAIKANEDEKIFAFNLHCGNALSFDFKKISQSVSENDGFDVVVGNPPYVCSRNMDRASLELLDRWSVTKSGHPDLYIPFFQIGYENLNQDGFLGLITVNTFIKSINGRALRDYFSSNQVRLKILNFGGEQVFKDRNTYTCICFISRNEGLVSYKRLKSTELDQFRQADFYHFKYNELNNYDGWNLTDSLDKNLLIRKIESVGKPFKELYVTRNGIATLRNDIYKFTPVDDDRAYFYHISSEGREFAIEKAICRKIINANKVRTEQDLRAKIERIIFPYRQERGGTIILEEKRFMSEFPCAYRYLKAHKAELSTRDKGAREYEKWYAYGRRQSMDIHAYKLFFPHICERPTFVISKDKDLLFYNGIAVVSNDIAELQLLKILLESDLFFDYIKNTTKDYSSGYISMSKNYIKNFGVIQLKPKDRERLMSASGNVNAIIREMYELDSAT